MRLVNRFGLIFQLDFCAEHIMCNFFFSVLYIDATMFVAKDAHKDKYLLIYLSISISSEEHLTFFLQISIDKPVFNGTILFIIYFNSCQFILQMLNGNVVHVGWIQSKSRKAVKISADAIPTTFTFHIFAQSKMQKKPQLWTIRFQRNHFKNREHKFAEEAFFYFNFNFMRWAFVEPLSCKVEALCS